MLAEAFLAFLVTQTQQQQQVQEGIKTSLWRRNIHAECIWYAVDVKEEGDGEALLAAAFLEFLVTQKQVQAGIKSVKVGVTQKRVADWPALHL